MTTVSTARLSLTVHLSADVGLEASAFRNSDGQLAAVVAVGAGGGRFTATAPAADWPAIHRSLGDALLEAGVDVTGVDVRDRIIDRLLGDWALVQPDTPMAGWLTAADDVAAPAWGHFDDDGERTRRPVEPLSPVEAAYLSHRAERAASPSLAGPAPVGPVDGEGVGS